MTLVRIFGDSHIVTVEAGAAGAWDVLNGLPVQFEYYARHGVNWHEFTTETVGAGFRFTSHRMPKLPPVDYVIDAREPVHVFSSPLHSAPFYRDAAWTGACPWSVASDNPDLQSVSDGVMASLALRQARCRLEMLARVRDGGFRIAVMEPPKPLRRAPKLHNLRPDVLRAADRFYRGLVADRLREHGIPLIAVRPATYEDDFTRPEFAAAVASDPHHANARFGALMIEDIARFALAA